MAFVRHLPPHPGPLPRGEGEVVPVVGAIQARGFAQTLGAWLPLPAGEGWGEGEREAVTDDIRCIESVFLSGCFSIRHSDFRE